MVGENAVNRTILRVLLLWGMVIMGLLVPILPRLIAPIIAPGHIYRDTIEALFQTPGFAIGLCLWTALPFAILALSAKYSSTCNFRFDRALPPNCWYYRCVHCSICRGILHSYSSNGRRSKLWNHLVPRLYYRCHPAWLLVTQDDYRAFVKRI